MAVPCMGSPFLGCKAGSLLSFVYDDWNNLLTDYISSSLYGVQFSVFLFVDGSVFLVFHSFCYLPDAKRHKKKNDRASPSTQPPSVWEQQLFHTLSNEFC